MDEQVLKITIMKIVICSILDTAVIALRLESRANEHAVSRAISLWARSLITLWRCALWSGKFASLSSGFLAKHAPSSYLVLLLCGTDSYSMHWLLCVCQWLCDMTLCHDVCGSIVFNVSWDIWNHGTGRSVTSRDVISPACAPPSLNFERLYLRF